MGLSTISSEQYRKMIAGASGRSPSKYRSKKTTVGSLTFDSKAEAHRYSELFILAQRGEITDFGLQPAFPIIVNGIEVCKYVADFRYRDSAGRAHIEDVKSKATMTPVYRLKKKLFEACYAPLRIDEVEVIKGRSVVRQPKPPKVVKPRKRKATADAAGAQV